MSRYPRPLGASLVKGLWEADFSVDVARYGAAGRDPAYAAGCMFRAIGVACHALHGHDAAWLINEKGMVASAGRLPSAPARFAERAQTLLAAVGTSTAEIAASVADAKDLLDEVRSACS